jgi:hypothetical protein
MSHLNLHKNGLGAKLCKVAIESGCTLIVAQVWEFDTEKEAREKEKSLKRAKNAPKVCPICKKRKEQNAQISSHRKD